MDQGIHEGVLVIHEGQDGMRGHTEGDQGLGGLWPDGGGIAFV